jgi:hypothetical protein|eukprot:COSAG01_NODE_5056_length_4520_cov_37.797557_2_plen_44_part_00
MLLRPASALSRVIKVRLEQNSTVESDDQTFNLWLTRLVFGVNV